MKSAAFEGVQPIFQKVGRLEKVIQTDSLKMEAFWNYNVSAAFGQLDLPLKIRGKLVFRIWAFTQGLHSTSILAYIPFNPDKVLTC